MTLISDSNVLLTGVTGLLGGELFRQFNARGHAGAVWALVRPTTDETPEQRVYHRLARSGDFAPPDCDLRAVAGDVLDADWGLSAPDRDEIAAEVDIIIHNAADTSFASHRDTARTNVGGVRRLIKFARTCRRNPLVVYMSTASNVGRVTGICLSEEDGCRPDNAHFNEYTQSKAIGEQLLRESGLQLLILRPSIVLSAGLPDPEFARQILWCAPLGRIFRTLPIDPAGRVDIVDVGFVATAAMALMACDHRTHDCYHLSAGIRAGATIGELTALIDRVYGRKTGLRLVPPSAWTRALHREHVQSALQKRVFRSLRHYLPFLNMDVVYDNARLSRELGVTAPPIRPVDEYLPDVLRLIRPKAALKEAALP